MTNCELEADVLTRTATQKTFWMGFSFREAWFRVFVVFWFCSFCPLSGLFCSVIQCSDSNIATAAVVNLLYKRYLLDYGSFLLCSCLSLQSCSEWPSWRKIHFQIRSEVLSVERRVPTAMSVGSDVQRSGRNALCPGNLFLGPTLKGFFKVTTALCM